MSSAVVADARWHLYRLLADPVRLRLLALAAEAELSVGELAELLDQTQPNVSRHASPLRQAGLLGDRRDGTRTFLRLTESTSSDPVVADALTEGRRLCEEEGSLARVRDVVRARDARTREYFATAHLDAEPEGGDLGAYLFALGALLPRRGVAVDAGTGDGTVLEAIAPLFERVIAVDRSQARLDRARRRTASRGYEHVEFVCGEVDGTEIRSLVRAGADVVVAGRMLHHAPVPEDTVSALSALLAPGGRLLVVDYGPHGDESFRESEADVWTGFEAKELAAFAAQAGLADVRVIPIPNGCWSASVGVRKPRPERIPWLALVGTKQGPEKGHEHSTRIPRVQD
jgi:DNA-binding transcriptional ArsR family regulator/2-polyprenyl-3-methyl-5-hydroxy-6-metoxy-1,4-benzoquinol methylase